MKPLDCGDLFVIDDGSLGVSVVAKSDYSQLCRFGVAGAAALQKWLACRNLGDEARSTEVSLREASDLFHKILSAIAAKRLLDCEGHKMPRPIHEGLVAKLLEPEAIERLAADGFEMCVRALALLGAEGVTIHECNPSEEPW